MKRILLKHESVYTDTVKHVTIDRVFLKEDLLFSSLIIQDRMDQRPARPGYHDFKIKGSQALTWLMDYVRDHFRLQTSNMLLTHTIWGNILLPREHTIKRNHQFDRDPPDYIMLYGIDVEDKSSELIIEYDREVNYKNNLMRFPLKDNVFHLFPAHLNYYISMNKGNQINCFLTVGCKL
tara:strand:- start:73 stop:609 length:537 start_codon:yes stop_codon:yes gene_type:complete